jgi:hypothetical protein
MQRGWALRWGNCGRELGGCYQEIYAGLAFLNDRVNRPGWDIRLDYHAHPLTLPFRGIVIYLRGAGSKTGPYTQPSTLLEVDS